MDLTSSPKSLGFLLYAQSHSERTNERTLGWLAELPELFLHDNYFSILLLLFQSSSSSSSSVLERLCLSRDFFVTISARYYRYLYRYLPTSTRNRDYINTSSSFSPPFFHVNRHLGTLMPLKKSFDYLVIFPFLLSWYMHSLFVWILPVVFHYSETEATESKF